MEPLDWNIKTAKAPLILAVTGHRDLRPQDIKALTARVTQLMRELRAKYPSTPFILLSPLAEGADRLVARVALLPEMKARLVVPLPMSVDLYENDFPDSKAEFRELLSQASASFVVPPDYDSHAVVTDKNARDQRYEAVANYIVRESQILVALWDGFPTEKAGSTGAVVTFQTQDSFAEREGNDQPLQSFLVYHVVTPRISEPNPRGAPFEIVEIYPSASEQESSDLPSVYYARIFSHLNEFNKEIEAGGHSLAQKAAESAKELVGHSDIVLTKQEQLGLQRYSVADALAIRFQNQVAYVYWVLATSLLLAGGSRVLFAHLEQHPPLFLAFYCLLLSAGLFTLKHATRLELDSKSQHYRALAEGCRVAFFWRVAGVTKSVCDEYFGAQRTDMDWIRAGLRDWDVNFDRSISEQPDVHSVRLRFALRRWLEGQINYFTNTAGRQHETLKTWGQVPPACLKIAVALVLIILVAAQVTQLKHFEWWACPDCGRWLALPVILIDLLLAFGAVVHETFQQRAFAQQNRQYRRMNGFFRNALRSARACLPHHPEAARHHLVELGHRALEENDDWAKMKRDYPVGLFHI